MSKLHKMLMEAERNSIRIIQRKSEYLKGIEGQTEFIEQEKQVFIQEQRKKINELHKYLDDKLSDIIIKYNQRIEQQLLTMYNSREKVSVDIDESLIYLKRLQNLNEKIMDHDPANIIEDFAKATAYLK